MMVLNMRWTKLDTTILTIDAMKMEINGSYFKRMDATRIFGIVNASMLVNLASEPW